MLQDHRVAPRSSTLKHSNPNKTHIEKAFRKSFNRDRTGDFPPPVPKSSLTPTLTAHPLHATQPPCHHLLTLPWDGLGLGTMLFASDLEWRKLQKET